MGKPCSMDLRERLVADVEAGHSGRAAARVYDVSPSTAVRLAAAQRERGDVSPKPQGRAPGTAGKLAAQQAFLLEIIRAEPDITLKELAAALAEAQGVRGQLSSLHRALRRAGTSYEKGLVAAEREKAERRRRRQDRIRRQRRMRELPHRVVFLDETSVRTGLTRLRGRGPRGERLYGSTPFGRWHSQTSVAGLTCDELIAPWITSGAMDGDAFDTYVETQLAPVLVPGTVVILDNLSTHRSPRAAASLRQRGCWFVLGGNRPPDGFLIPRTAAALQS